MPAKGPREQITFRVPAGYKPRFQAEADRRGLALGDYLAVIAAEAHGLDRPQWIADDSGQEVLLPETA